MSFAKHAYTITYDADGAETIRFDDGITFGPYGPDECPAVHPSGMTCKHKRGHIGCHSTYDDATTDKFKYRWTS